ncbi:MAG: DegV family protein [Lachnospiraceae bacterium]|nr:DegV family protein [Lachnospiraceae bacterium]
MAKVAIMTDTNSGITRAEGKENGIHVLSMPFMIDDINYLEGVNLDQDQFFDFMEKKSVIQTSQPSPAEVTGMFSRLLETHDQVVYIPMSSGLSGSCQTAMMLANEEEFEGKVFVVNNQRISVPQKQSVYDALAMAEAGMDGQQIHDKLMEDKFNNTIYIMLDTLYYLKKGGRITPAAAAVGTLLKIKPVLQIQGEKLDAYSKARTSALGKKIIIDALKKDIETRFGGLDEGAKDRIILMMAYTKDLDRALEFKEEIKEAFPGFNDPILNPLALSIACHTGPGAIAAGCVLKTTF